jgi:hypothetical protein
VSALRVPSLSSYSSSLINFVPNNEPTETHKHGDNPGFGGWPVWLRQGSVVFFSFLALCFKLCCAKYPLARLLCHELDGATQFSCRDIFLRVNGSLSLRPRRGRCVCYPFFLFFFLNFVRKNEPTTRLRSMAIVILCVRWSQPLKNVSYGVTRRVDSKGLADLGFSSGCC